MTPIPTPGSSKKYRQRKYINDLPTLQTPIPSFNIDMSKTNPETYIHEIPPKQCTQPPRTASTQDFQWEPVEFELKEEGTY